MSIRALRPYLALLALLPSLALSAAGAGPVSADDYRAALLEIYGRYQAVLAHPEACNAAFPQMRAATDTAFNAWRARHGRFIDELEQRVALMIRAHSKDEKDYSRNFGRFQGGILRQREEVKQTLLVETRGELEARCKGLPDFLNGRQSDLESEFPDEVRVLRQWPLSSR